MESIVTPGIQRYKRSTYLNYSGDDEREGQETQRKIVMINGESNINPKISDFRSNKNESNNNNNNNGRLLGLKNKSDFIELNVEYKDFEFTKLISEDNETNSKIEDEIMDSPEFCTSVLEIDPTLSLNNLKDEKFLNYNTANDDKDTKGITKTSESHSPLYLNFQLITIVDDEQYQCDFGYESFYKEKIKN
ncbi:unnamed protein product [[Candida] boidinii]|uniref:Unnamed protein product n=1 Tax=Candida boidinii TaxID=5477 RepID=A0A9W6T0V2_CANBO|nr:unnamed protein product [[Candida] boidinii]